MTSTVHKITPDKVLEEASCGKCLKYLTVGPIGVTSLGENTCGRCSKSSDPSVSPILLEYYGEYPDEFIPLTILGYASSRNYLFPCVNRFEGCSTVLPYFYIKQHEEECLSQKRECPLCSYHGIGSQLFEHFKRKHYKNLLTSNSNLALNLRKNVRKKYLYKTAKSLFIMKFRFVADLNLFMIRLRYLGSVRKKTTSVKCCIQLYSSVDYNASLTSQVFSVSNNSVNMNFRINDVKIIDLEVISMNFVVLEM